MKRILIVAFVFALALVAISGVAVGQVDVIDSDDTTLEITYNDGTIYVLSENTQNSSVLNVTAYDTSDGSIVWHQATNIGRNIGGQESLKYNPVENTIAVGGGQETEPNQRAYFKVFNADDGSLLFEDHIDRGASGDGIVEGVAIDRETGEYYVSINRDGGDGPLIRLYETDFTQSAQTTAIDRFPRIAADSGRLWAQEAHIDTELIRQQPIDTTTDTRNLDTEFGTETFDLAYFRGDIYSAYGYRFDGADLSTEWNLTGFNWTEGSKVEPSNARDTVFFWNNTSGVIETDLSGDIVANDSDVNSSTFTVTDETGDEAVVWWFNGTHLVAEGVSPNPLLELQFSAWMEHGSTQEYTVIDQRTGGDVTSASTVTSGNTSVVTVDMPSETLTATSDESVNNVVTISASYDGESVSKNITVANRTLGNIGILPPSTWVYAFLSGEDDLLGGETQWLYVAIILGTIASFITRNNYIGIGAIAALNFLFWVGGYVSLGILLSSIFYVIFTAIVLADIDSQSPTVYVNR